MGRRPRRMHSPAFKAKAVVTAIKVKKTMIELAREFDVHLNQIKPWRDQLDTSKTPFLRGIFSMRIAGEVFTGSVQYLSHI